MTSKVLIQRSILYERPEEFVQRRREIPMTKNSNTHLKYTLRSPKVWKRTIDGTKNEFFQNWDRKNSFDIFMDKDEMLWQALFQQ